MVSPDFNLPIKNDSLKLLEKKLQHEKNPKNGFLIAKDILKLIGELKPEEKGNLPNFSRLPGRARKGEEWFRNRLLWLRTIPLEKDISFVIVHSETAVYYEGSGGKRSADLLGIWHSKKNTKLGVIELKARKIGDHVLYAILEGARNTYLHYHTRKRLHSGWINTNSLNQNQKRGEEGLFCANVWNKGNPFPPNLKKAHLIIIGDSEWIKAQDKRWKGAARNIIKEIQRKVWGFETSIYSLNDKAKHNSKPYVLLPLTKWL